MDAQVKAIVSEITAASDEGSLAFPQVVAALGAAGVERYHADLALSTKTYYMPDGTAETVPCHDVGPAAAVFSAGGVDAAVRAIQAGSIGYRAFCERLAEAGCVGYFVTLAGRRAIYYGRTGDSHVESFPGAAP
ncbi:MAG: DUF1398 domain-containing protein [Pseudomonadota bacterium]